MKRTLKNQELKFRKNPDSLNRVSIWCEAAQKHNNKGQKWKRNGIIATQSTFYYLCLSHLCLLGEAGGYIDAVEATSQDTNNKEVEDEADEVNPTLLPARAIRDFLLDPLFFQIRLGETQRKDFNGNINYTVVTF